MQRSKHSLSRPKAQLACNLCKLKKIKCDRKHPCSNCRSRPIGTCVYPQNVLAEGHDKHHGYNRATDWKTTLGQRISRLEDLISEVTNADYGKTPTSAGDAPLASDRMENVLENPPHLQSVGERSKFTNSSHWETVLNEMTGIKSHLQAAQDSEIESTNLYLLCCAHTEVTLPELFGTVPSESSVTALLDILANCDSVASVLTVVHIPTLRKECQAFFQDPFAAKLSWMALLFALMAWALQMTRSSEERIEGIGLPDAAIELYTLRSAQCLIKSDYSKPTDHTIQAMLLYLSCEHNRIGASELRASLVLGMVVRLATSLGYHRDPGHFPQMSNLQSELRRRTWALIVQMDLILAEKCGLPRSIDDTQTDTLPPMNVKDDDLIENAKETPSSDPENQSNQATYLSYKMKLLGIQGKIFDLVNSPRALAYEEVLRLDKVLTLAVNCKPAWVRQLREDGAADVPSHHLKQAIEIDLMANRARMVLHRKYLVTDRSNQYHDSRRICLDASRDVLRLQSELTETLRCHSNAARDRRLLSLLGHHFLLAAMLLSLNIQQSLTYHGTSEGNRDDNDLEQLSEDVRQLQQSCQLWTELRFLGTIAENGTRTVAIMLECLRQSHELVDRSLLSGRSNAIQEQIPVDQSRSYGDSSVERHHPTDGPPPVADGAGGYHVSNTVVENSQALPQSEDMIIQGFDESLLNMQDLLGNAQMGIDWSAWDAQYLAPGWMP